MKRAFSFVLAVVMLLSIITGLNCSVLANDHTHNYVYGYCKGCSELDPSYDFAALPAELDTRYDLTIDNQNKYAVYSFTAPENEYYDIVCGNMGSSCKYYVATDGKKLSNGYLNRTYIFEQNKEYLIVFYQNTNDKSSSVYFTVSKHNHSFYSNTTNPTCTRDGSTVTRCYLCSYQNTEVLPATGEHNYVNGFCTMCYAAEPGYVRQYTDLVLNTEYEITAEKKGETTYFHFTPEETTLYEWEAPNSKAFPSYVSYKNNTATLNEGTQYEINVTPNDIGTTSFKLFKHSHTYAITTTPATCRAEGSSAYKCTVCGDSYTETLPVDEKAHKFVNGKCFYCGLIDESYTVSYTELLLGTTTDKMPIMESEYLYFKFTPETDGCYQFRISLYTSQSTVSNRYSSSISLNGEPVNSRFVASAYSCYADLEAGKEYVLTVQNGVNKDCELDIRTYKHNHIYKTYTNPRPDCIHGGEITYTCFSCDYTYTEELAPTGVHNYLNGYCTVCGAVDESYVKVVTPVEEDIEADFDSTIAGTANYYLFTPEETGEYVIKTSSVFLVSQSSSKYPSIAVRDEDLNPVECVSNGRELPCFYSYYNLEAGKNYEISVSGSTSQTGTVVISKHKHNIVSDGNTAKCDDYATETKSCTAVGCEYKETVEYEPTGIHEFAETVVAPNCSSFGYTQYSCKTCDFSYMTDYVASSPEAHSYKNGVCEFCGKYEDESKENKIVIGTTQSYTVKNEDDEAVFTFVPETDGYYLFRSSTSYDPFVEVYDESGEFLFESDDMTSTNYNFKLIGKFSAGKKYFFCFGCYEDYGHSGDYTVSFTSSVHSHSYSKKTVLPNCGRKGYTKYTCSCGNYYISQSTEKVGSHNYSVIETVSPTCSEAGYKVYYCSKCGDIYTEEGEPATGAHSYKDGVCENCGALDEAHSHKAALSEEAPYLFESTDTVGEFEFSFVADESAAYIFETLGKSETSAYITDESDNLISEDLFGSGYGDNCRVVFEAEKGRRYTISLDAENEAGLKFSAKIYKHTHNFKYFTYPATCGEEGLQLASCILCKHQETEILKPTEKHNFENGVCTVCSLKEGESILDRYELKRDIPSKATEGDGDTFFFTPAHSCTATVYSTGKLITTASVYTVDEQTQQTKLIAEDYDSSGELMNFKMSFEVEKGKTYYLETGENDGEYQINLEYQNEAHSFTHNVIAPNCTEQGYTLHTCGQCGYSYKDNYTQTNDNHNYCVVKSVSPTCSREGYKELICSLCSDKHTEKIPRRAHAPVTDKAVSATFKAAGKTEGSHCKNCGAVIKEQKTVAKLGSPSLSKVSAGKKQFKATWKAVAGVDGYEIRYATSTKALSKAKPVAIGGYKSTGKTVKKLKAKKKYFVQIRAYKTVNGKKQYSAWSKNRAVTTRK